MGPGQSPLPEPGSLPPRPGPAGTRTLHSQAGAQPRARSRPGAALPSPHRRAGAELIGQINFQFQRLLSPAMQPLGGGGRAGLAGPLLSQAAFLALRAGRRHAQPGAHLRACGRGGRVLPGPTPATADPVPPPWASRCHDTALARVPLQWREPWLEVGRPSLAHPTKAWAAAGPVRSAVGLWSRRQRGCARRQTLV